MRYDGGAQTLQHRLLQDWRAAERIVAFCPEMAAGFAVPRLPAEIEPGKNSADVLAGRGAILDSAGKDVTQPFLEGARLTLGFAQAQGCGFALLTDGSPSCGTEAVYDGRFSGQRIAGMGVVSALLHKHGISVFAPHRIADLAARLPA